MYLSLLKHKHIILAPADRVNYQVLATDYANFSIVYSCLDIEDEEASEEFSWVMARQPTLVPEIDYIIDNLLITLEIEVENFEITIQDEELCLLGITPFPGAPRK